MCPSTEGPGRSGGVIISSPIGSVGGDVVGGNKGLDEERVVALLREEQRAEEARRKAIDEEIATIGGTWVDASGSISQVTQTGDSFYFVLLNRQTGLRSQGTGSIKGHRFNMTFQTNVPSTGTATGTVSADGLEITETVQDSVFGGFSLTARKL
jgi:hypothetical protein